MNDNEAHQFRSPYATAPVGPLRFEHSQAYNGSSNISALTTGASCMQPYEGIVVPGPQSEDCLFLNIFTPSLRAADIPHDEGDDEMRPVIFWIHVRRNSSFGSLLGCSLVPLLRRVGPSYRELQAILALTTAET